ncbi:lactate utilization protein C [Telmatospirillum sp.]|uniref:LutC/YkgG family protein n=1 Tax=Telmatospirillum sp. TaxID=2079197 RepID=UPI0028489D68|nr:lactate utilization protein C [Telmatospirillum sp.]MDR3436900.1 lactate utilization protein C [Telmatospirillum sp.]
MSNNARSAILERLRKAPKKPIPDLPPWSPYVTTTESAFDRFRRMITAVKGEVIETSRANLAATIRQVLADKQASNLLYAPNTDIGKTLDKAWAAEPGPRLVPYDKPIEDLKSVIVNDIDAGITSTMGAIADTGSLIVWPSVDEPRLMSLVPPIHIAVLEVSKMFDSFPEAVAKLGWNKKPPGNTLLISGPSKTADIEGILCFGVHGPKQLVVLAITD